jgi:cytochrome c6
MPSAVIFLATALGVAWATDGKPSGESLFNRYCVSCHPGGGNIMTPQRTLFRIDRDSRGLRKPADIVRFIRHPSGRMPKFDRGQLSDKEAEMIGQYIISTFK